MVSSYQSYGPQACLGPCQQTRVLLYTIFKLRYLLYFKLNQINQIVFICSEERQKTERYITWIQIYIHYIGKNLELKSLLIITLSLSKIMSWVEIIEDSNFVFFFKSIDKINVQKNSQLNSSPFLGIELITVKEWKTTRLSQYRRSTIRKTVWKSQIYNVKKKKH